MSGKWLRGVREAKQPSKRVPDAKSDDLSLIPQTYLLKGENKLLHMLCVCLCMSVHVCECVSMHVCV